MLVYPCVCVCVCVETGNPLFLFYSQSFLAPCKLYPHTLFRNFHYVAAADTGWVIFDFSLAEKRISVATLTAMVGAIATLHFIHCTVVKIVQVHLQIEESITSTEE